MKSFKQICEDSQDAGYTTTLETPRSLGVKDLLFVETNKPRKVGESVLDFKSKEIIGSFILKNDDEFFQYSHHEDNEVHIESVELYRDLWVSIHIPKSTAKLVSK